MFRRRPAVECWDVGGGQPAKKSRPVAHMGDGPTKKCCAGVPIRGDPENVGTPNRPFWPKKMLGRWPDANRVRPDVVPFPEKFTVPTFWNVVPVPRFGPSGRRHNISGNSGQSGERPNILADPRKAPRIVGTVPRLATLRTMWGRRTCWDAALPNPGSWGLLLRVTDANCWHVGFARRDFLML